MNLFYIRGNSDMIILKYQMFEIISKIYSWYMFHLYLSLCVQLGLFSSIKHMKLIIFLFFFFLLPWLNTFYWQNKSLGHTYLQSRWKNAVLPSSQNKHSQDICLIALMITTVHPYSQQIFGSLFLPHAKHSCSSYEPLLVKRESYSMYLFSPSFAEK